jgi:hypothetical protein
MSKYEIPYLGIILHFILECFLHLCDIVFFFLKTAHTSFSFLETTRTSFSFLETVCTYFFTLCFECSVRMHIYFFTYSLHCIFLLGWIQCQWKHFVTCHLNSCNKLIAWTSVHNHTVIIFHVEFVSFL